MPLSEEQFQYLITDLSIDTSGHWSLWNWSQVAPMTSYEHALLEEFRDEVIVAYRLYNRVGLEHARRILQDLPRNARLLDAGGGTGRKAIPLAQMGFTDITVMDIAPEWLRLAAEKAQVAQVQDQLTLAEGDILRMRDFADEHFDAVIALGGVVSYCGDPAGALAEMCRVLKPGGKLLADGIHSYFGSIKYAARNGNLEFLEQLTCSPQQLNRIPALLPEELEAIAVQAGLTDVLVGAEFIFEVDDNLRIGSDTERWEKVILELEMRYYDDPRFLGSCGLMLQATKSNKSQNPA